MRGGVAEEPRKVVNVASVPKLSPFRYPGGKTWLVPEIRAWLGRLPYRPETFVEPFTGGGIASLIAVTENHVDRAVMSELDAHVAAVWRTILDEGEWLIDRILSFEMTVENVVAVLAADPEEVRDAAFQTIIRNRAQRGGIMARGASLMKAGENGRGIASRWYPSTLAKRIATIHSHRDRIEFIHGDGLDVIRQYAHEDHAAFFVDPPYTAGGKKAGSRLYTHNELDHAALFDLMGTVAGDFMLTYDEAAEVVELAKAHGFRLDRVPMKNTHHAHLDELLILPPARALLPAEARRTA